MRPINRIIVHHSLTKDGQVKDFDAIKRYHMTEMEMTDIGYHYVIEYVNNAITVKPGRALETLGGHTKGYNNDSIGICVVGNFDIETQPADATDALVKLCVALMQKFTINILNVQPHHFYAPYKSCPGHMFDWTLFIVSLQLALAAGMTAADMEKTIKGDA